MKQPPLRPDAALPRRPAARLDTELVRRLRRDAAALPGPSPSLRPRILHAVREERRTLAPARDASRGLGLRLVAVAAAVVIALLLWDPARLREARPLPPPNAFVGQMLGLSDYTSFVEAVDGPLWTEMGHLVTDTTRVAEGVAARFADSPFAHLLAVGGRGADGR